VPDEECIFCRIVSGELPSTIVHRADGFVAIEDIAPKAPVHLLVIPERHVATFREIGSFEAEEARRMLEFVAATAREAGAEDYRVIVNVGPQAGQTVFHLHWHVLAGSRLPFA
jgi:histidine triad (HIT) family protein